MSKKTTTQETASQTKTYDRKKISRKERFEILDRDNFTCRYCGQSAPDVVLHIDHVHPVAKGGTNDHSNLVTACSSCNSGKSDSTINSKNDVGCIYSDETQKIIDNNAFLLDKLIKNDDLFACAHKALTLMYVAGYDNPLVQAICNILDAADEHSDDIENLQDYLNSGDLA